MSELPLPKRILEAIDRASAKVTERIAEAAQDLSPGLVSDDQRARCRQMIADIFIEELPPPIPEHPRRVMDPWIPMTEPIDLKHIGKLGEEAAELAAICSRIVIQDIDEQDPTSEKPNRDLLEDEIADVAANVILVTKHFSLDRGKMDGRSLRKQKLLAQWHGALR